MEVIVVLNEKARACIDVFDPNGSIGVANDAEPVRLDADHEVTPTMIQRRFEHQAERVTA